MLPAALDPSLVARAADGLWDILGEHMPRLKRHDSSTWTTFVGEEQILRRMDQGKSHAGGDVLFECKGSRFSTRNGAEQSMLDCLPRQLWSLAEQMMGAGEVATFFAPRTPFYRAEEYHQKFYLKQQSQWQ